MLGPKNLMYQGGGREGVAMLTCLKFSAMKLGRGVVIDKFDSKCTHELNVTYAKKWWGD